jgi:hypothetical protein
MFDLFIIALLQLATLTSDAPAKIGSSGWDVDAAKTTSTSKIGSSGWDVDAAKTTSASKIGSSGWDVD